ncbi:HlyD family type I secretion periplasmic adaptor subunit [Fodinicurvata sp. EGI_FJ10296]|uniref:HlyD family type I secretion periplasmic adaptor subunit n=1 Tax=Fodinicurvata sp. EGI_FJ10296 TaxID=3231908 RepID=UPI00345582DA
MSVHSRPIDLRSPTLHASILFTILVFATIVLMSIIFKVEVVARGEGRVVPVSRVQVVQPEFSGRIEAIHVRNGDAVAQGDVLIELDATSAVSDLRTNIAEQQRLLIERARVGALVRALITLDLRAETLVEESQALFDLPANLSGHPYATEQSNLLEAEILDLQSSIAQIDAREESSRRAEEVTRASIARIDAALETQGDRLRTAEHLLERGATSRTDFLDVQQAFTDMEKDRDINLRELDRQAAERVALEAERRRLVTELRSDHLGRITQIEARLSTLTEEALALERRVNVSTLTAPVSGIVDRLGVYTIGGVAEAGDELLRIVPTEVQIEFEGQFTNQDIGFMEVGQRANLGMSAYPSERFGFVRGEVSDIAADSTEVSEGRWGYVVQITPEANVLQVGNDTFSLRPGMTATVDVTTDERRIITYFFAPIVRTIQDAMGER